jgi:uncharacterized protein YodC (DUF2158 family)
MKQFNVGDIVHLHGDHQHMKVTEVNEKTELLHCEWQVGGTVHRIYVPFRSAVLASSSGAADAISPEHREIRT